MIDVIKTSKVNLEKSKEAVNKWCLPPKAKADILRFVDELGLGKINRGVRVSEYRQIKYLYLLRVPLEYIAKDLRQITIRDVEDFERALSKNEVFHGIMRVEDRRGNEKPDVSTQERVNGVELRIQRMAARGDQAGEWEIRLCGSDQPFSGCCLPDRSRIWFAWRRL
jgi:hypothetical protein